MDWIKNQNEQRFSMSLKTSKRSAGEQKPKQPWPNHNWCVGCSPDNCSGCGTEPLERRAPQPDYKAQRDAERYRFLRDSQEGKTIRIKPRLLWNEEIDSAIASVKGGA